MAATEQLTIQVNEELLQELKCELGGERGLDYFQLLGLSRGASDPAEVDRAVITKIKVLRPWQNSPHYGDEVVKLMPLIHRIGKVLKDAARREAYLGALERSERGEEANAADVFKARMRAALADQFQESTQQQAELERMASNQGLSNAEATAIIDSVREEMRAQTIAASADTGSGSGDWEFSIAGEGEETFGMMLTGMESSGTFDERSCDQWIDVGIRKYALEPHKAREMVIDFQRTRFRKMVQRASAGDSLGQEQIDILMDKAPAYGLNPAEARKVLDDFTFVVTDVVENFDELFGDLLDNDDNAHLVDESAFEYDSGPAKRHSGAGLPDWLGPLLTITAIVAVLGGGAWMIKSNMGGRGKGVIERKTSSTKTNASAGATAAAPVPVATTTEIPDDPASGVIGLDPVSPSDPAPFLVAIREVSCFEYQGYVKSMKIQSPMGWNARGDFPDGTADRPVTGITWEEAMGYCNWLGDNRGYPAGSVTLPTQAELRRAAAGSTLRGSPTDPHYWREQRLYESNRLRNVGSSGADSIIHYGKGRVYDLLANAAEWTCDERNGRYAVFGGDYKVTDPSFKLFDSRWERPDLRRENIGFRYVIHEQTAPGAN